MTKLTDLPIERWPTDYNSLAAQAALLTAEEKASLVNRKEKNGDTLLHIAVGLNQLSVVNVLLDCGADREAKGMYGETPLHRAALNNKYVDIAACLIERGANCEARRFNNEPPIHVAAINGADKIVELLVKQNKAQLALTSKEKRTPMFSAVLAGHLNVVRVLFKQGDSLDQLDPWLNESLLSYSVKNRQAQILKFIIDNKQNVDKTQGDLEHFFDMPPEHNFRGLRRLVELLLVHRTERDLSHHQKSKPLTWNGS